MSPAIVLDPSEVAAARTELDLTAGGLRVDAAGIDWGDAQIQAYMADLTIGSMPVDYRLPNRVITIPLTIGANGSFDTARGNLQKKVALIQREGGWLKRATGLYADLVNASLVMPDRDAPAFGYEREVRLVLEALPDFYGDEVTSLSTHTETTLPELIFTESTINGDHPGRARVVVAELQGKSQLGLLWGFRSRFYDSASTAHLAYEAEALTPLDAAATGALSGASGGNVVSHSKLSTEWTPVLSTDISGTGSMTHVGSYRVWARVYSTSATPPDVRFLYDVGDFTLPSENAAVAIPAASHFYLVDLGEIRIDKARVGTHRWKGAIQARGAAGGENVSIDRLFFQPLDDGAGRLVAPVNTDVGLVAYSARDEFNQSAGSLTGKTLPSGQTWAGVPSTDADDFVVNATKHVAARNSVSDVSVGRIVRVGSATATDIVVALDHSADANAVVGGPYGGPACRVIDETHWFAAIELHDSSTTSDGCAIWQVLKWVGGAFPVVLATGYASAPLSAAVYRRQQLVATSTGDWWYYREGAVVASGNDSALATGGALASGGYGILDQNDSASAIVRNYNNFAAWVPTGDAVLFASEAAELRWDSMQRLDASGAAYGPVTEVIGDLPRVPPSALEARPLEVFLKATRGDFDQLPDAGIDDISAQVLYRPSYLFRP